MTNILQALLLSLLGNAAIYTGITFVNGKLFPAMWHNFYDQSVVWQRVLIMSLLTAPLVNYFFSVVYRKVDAGMAGMMILGTLAAVLVAKAMLTEGLALNLRIVAAAAVLILAAIWVAYELHNAVHQGV